MQCIRLAFPNDSPEMIRLRRLLCNKSFMMEAAWDKQKLTVGATVPGYHGVDLGTILLNGGSGDRTPRVRFAAELMHGPRLKGFFLLRWVQEVLWERFLMGPVARTTAGRQQPQGVKAWLTNGRQQRMKSKSSFFWSSRFT
jgi:hypothetical protein